MFAYIAAFEGCYYTADSINIHAVYWQILKRQCDVTDKVWRSNADRCLGICTVIIFDAAYLIVLLQLLPTFQAPIFILWTPREATDRHLPWLNKYLFLRCKYEIFNACKTVSVQDTKACEGRQVQFHANWSSAMHGNERPSDCRCHLSAFLTRSWGVRSVHTLITLTPMKAYPLCGPRNRLVLEA
jgi:hypothetical protein